MAKFKEGSLVRVITSGHKSYVGRIGVVIDYITKDRLSVDFGKPIGALAVDECNLEPLVEAIYTGETANVIEALKPKPIVSSVKDAFTDPNVDYEALSEEPVYYEFIDIGKALNKLKKYEHLGCKTSDSEEVVYIVRKISHAIVSPHVVLKKEYNGRDLIKYTVMNQLGSKFDVYPTDESIAIFANFKEAIAYVKLRNKLDEVEETPF